MSSKQSTYLTELVEDIKAMDDPAILAVACRALADLLHYDLAGWKEETEA